MAQISGGVSGAVLGVGAEAANGAHGIAKPCAYGSLGHYVVDAQSGAIAAGAGSDSPVFSFRWGDATRLAVVTEISITGMRATTAFAAGAIDIKATIARSFSASDTGGTSILPAANMSEMRTSMGTTLLTDLRISSTAALGAGTRTLDTQNLGQITTHSSAGWQGATPIVGSIYLPRNDLFLANVDKGEHPLVLAQNEGFIVRATVPGTGVWNIGVRVKWAEVTAY